MGIRIKAKRGNISIRFTIDGNHFYISNKPIEVDEEVFEKMKEHPFFNEIEVIEGEVMEKKREEGIIERKKEREQVKKIKG